MCVSESAATLSDAFGLIAMAMYFNIKEIKYISYAEVRVFCTRYEVLVYTVDPSNSWNMR